MCCSEKWHLEKGRYTMSLKDYIQYMTLGLAFSYTYGSQSSDSPRSDFNKKRRKKINKIKKDSRKANRK